MKIIYIVSSPRSGSTLLSLVLGKHPLIANLGEVAFIPKLLALRELCTCGTPLLECERWGGVFDLVHARTGVDLRVSPYGYLGDVIKRGRGLVDHAYQTPWLVRRATMRAVADRIVLALPVWLGATWYTLPSIKKSLNNTVLLYEAAAQSWNKQLVVDASKMCRTAVHLYLRYPGRVRIIHLIRDGRGVVASHRKQMSVQQTAARWRRYQVYALKLLEKWVAPEHRKMLRYEDFAESPELRIGAVCAWLDIPFSDQMLRFEEAPIIHSAGGSPTRFKISSGLYGVDQRWRSLLNTQDLHVFERIAGELNRRFGFQ